MGRLTSEQRALPEASFGRNRGKAIPLSAMVDTILSAGRDISRGRFA
jgi:hypothetical protein